MFAAGRHLEDAVPGPLVHYVEGGLKGIEQAALYRPDRLLVLLAVADEPGLALALYVQHSLDHVVRRLSENVVGVYLQQVDVVPSSAA